MNKKQKLVEQEKLNKMTKYDRKNYLRNKKAKEEKKKKIIYSIIAVLCVVSIIGLVFLAKDSQRKVNYETYATIGENEISYLEFDYYYCMNVNNWLNNNYYYLEYYGIDIEKDLGSQIKDETTKETWEDYFVKNTKDFITNVYSIYDDAKKNNFTEWKEEYESFIKTVKENAKASDMNYLKYIKSYYGNNLTEKDFENYSKTFCMVSAYDQYIYKNFENSVTNEEIEKLYNENKNNYDTVNYLMFTMSVENTSKTTDKEKETLKNNVTGTVATIKDKESFIKEAKENSKAKDFDEKSVTYRAIGIDNVYYSDCSKWLFDETRKEGDIISISNTDETIYYILYFVDRKLDTENTANLRIIYKQFVADDKDTDDTYTEKEAEDKIQEIADKFTLGDANETEFANLAIENGFSDGGLNKYVSKNSLVIDSIAEWTFEKGREKGDITIVKEDDVVYLLYYIDEDIPYYRVMAKNNLSQDKYNEYIKELKNEFKIAEKK